MTDLNDRSQRLRSELREFKEALSLPVGWGDFFRDRLTEQRAKDEIKGAMDHREKSFLELARRETSP